ncbi:MAG: PepSY domain-containing protein [Pseudomonadota bacterium]|nr:PepSY domain-containing protein [Pseudomonadota bacterium]
MKPRNIVAAALIAAFLSLVGGGLVYAKQAQEAENDAVTGLRLARISLVQAVNQAEAHAGGKATKAELENERGVPTFEVEVVTGQNQVFDVQVDARDGTVLSSHADTADADADADADHGDHDDDDNRTQENKRR